MTEIQRLFTETADDLNIREKRGNKPRFSISFIRKRPRLFIGMYVVWFVTLTVMLQSETLVDSVWLLAIPFVILNGFFFLDVAPRYHFEDINVLGFRVCYNGEWYNIHFAPSSLINTILHSPSADSEYKTQLQRTISRKGEPSSYDVFTLTRAQTSQ